MRALPWPVTLRDAWFRPQVLTKRSPRLAHELQVRVKPRCSIPLHLNLTDKVEVLRHHHSEDSSVMHQASEGALPCPLPRVARRRSRHFICAAVSLEWTGSLASACLWEVYHHQWCRSSQALAQLALRQKDWRFLTIWLRAWVMDSLTEGQ